MPSVKEHFTSRWGDEGVLIEADWTGMEVAVFAFLTQDSTLIADLREGVDIHTTMYAKCYGIDYDDVTKEQRSGIKACTFHVIYGGGAKSMAIRMDIPEDFCKQFINNFYGRYPMAKMWQDNLVRQVEASRTILDETTDKGHRKHQGVFKSLTGRKYYFKTNDTPKFLEEKGIVTGFNPPEIKNYPVQGLATADIHMIALGNLFRKCLLYRDNILLINTVHDSVLLDCRKDFLEKGCILVRDGLYCIKNILKDRFNIEFNVPLGVEIKVGKSWAEMNKYNF